MAAVRFIIATNTRQLTRAVQADLNTHPAFRDFFNQTALRYRRFTQQRYDRFSRGAGDWEPLSPRTIKSRLLGGEAKTTIGSAGQAVAKQFREARKSRLDAAVTLLNKTNGRGVSVFTRTITNIEKKEKRLATRQAKITEAAGRVMILRNTGTMFRALSLNSNGANTRNIANGIQFGFAQSQYAPPGHEATNLTYAKLYSIHHYGTKRIPARPILVRPDQATLKAMQQDASTALRKALAT